MGHLERMRFDNAMPGGRRNRVDSELFGSALEYAKKYAEEPKGWLVLEGLTGTGKTHLAAAILNDVIDRGNPAKYVSALDIADLIRLDFRWDADDDSRDSFMPLLSAPLLVVDDLGAHHSTDWVESRIDQLMTHRFNRGLPTVIVLAKPLNELPERIALKLDDPDLSEVLRLSPSLAVSGSGAGGTIPAAMLDRMTFDSFNADGAASATADERASLSIALGTAKEFASRPERWLYLHGLTGVGKTHLAVAIANVRISQGGSVSFWTVPDLLDRLRHAYSSDDEASFYNLFDEVRSSELLVLDDFGAQNMTDWALEKIYQLLVHRHDRMMPTVITSQHIIWEGAHDLDQDRMRGRQQWGSLHSRLKDTSVVTECLMIAPDYRNRLA